MSRFHISKSAQCPFYTADVKQAVHCEGLFHGNTIHMVFQSEKKWKSYMKRFCCGEYKDCLICKMLNTLWEEP